MNLYNLFEDPKQTPAQGTTGVMDNQVQSAASPIGSGTSKWEHKKKPVTIMGVGNNGVVAEARDVQLDEISNKILGDYKKAAGADATAADKAGDIERGNKRFRGIVKATVKQGENDAKQHKEQGMAEGSLEEVSQDTARSYAQKARVSQKDLINQTHRKGADTNKLNKKIQNRQQGLNRAHTDKRYYKDEQGMAEDWQKANKRDKTDGMSQKAVNAYRRENPGSKLQTAVTTKPSKLKKGGKASKRRKSYCSRSRGQMKMHSISCAKTPDKAICKARRRWNC